MSLIKMLLILAGTFEPKQIVFISTNNNEYLERLTRTGPKRLRILYKYIVLSKFNAVLVTAGA